MRDEMVDFPKFGHKYYAQLLVFDPLDVVKSTRLVADPLYGVRSTHLEADPLY